MVALDLACNGLRPWSHNIICSTPIFHTVEKVKYSKVIVVGANLICNSEVNITLSSMDFLSFEGRCHSFDHRANGYGRGEDLVCLFLNLSLVP